MAGRINFNEINLRVLKGAPLSVLTCLANARLPLEAERIQAETGYSDKPVMFALQMLREWGYVIQIDRYHWALANGARQLPLMIDSDQENQL